MQSQELLINAYKQFKQQDTLAFKVTFRQLVHSGTGTNLVHFIKKFGYADSDISTTSPSGALIALIVDASISPQVTFWIPTPILSIGLLAKVQKRQHKTFRFLNETLTEELENDVIVRTK